MQQTCNFGSVSVPYLLAIGMLVLVKHIHVHLFSSFVIWLCVCFLFFLGAYGRITVVKYIPSGNEEGIITFSIAIVSIRDEILRTCSPVRYLQ